VADVGSLNVAMTGDASQLQAELAKSEALVGALAKSIEQGTTQAIKNAGATVTGFTGSLFSDPLGALAGAVQQLPYVGELLALPFEAARFALRKLEGAVSGLSWGEMLGGDSVESLRETAQAWDEVVSAAKSGIGELVKEVVGGGVGAAMRGLNSLFDDAGGEAESFVTRVGKGVTSFGRSLRDAAGGWQSLLSPLGLLGGEAGGFLDILGGQLQRLGSQGRFSLEPLQAIVIDLTEYVAVRLAKGAEAVWFLLQGWVPVVEHVWATVSDLAGFVVPLVQQAFAAVTAAASDLSEGVTGVGLGGQTLYETLQQVPAVLLSASATALEFGANLIESAMPFVNVALLMTEPLVTGFNLAWEAVKGIFSIGMQINAVYVDTARQVAEVFERADRASRGWLANLAGGGVLGAAGRLLSGGTGGEGDGEGQLSLAERVRAAAERARAAAEESRRRMLGGPGADTWLGFDNSASARVGRFFDDLRDRLGRFKKDAEGGVFPDFTKERDRLLAMIESPLEKFDRHRELVDKLAGSVNDMGQEWLDADEAALAMLRGVEDLQKAVGGDAVKGVAALQEGSREAYSAVARFQRGEGVVDENTRIRQLLERAEAQAAARLEQAKRVAEILEEIRDGEGEEED
jgi:hypothetical protein